MKVLHEWVKIDQDTGFRFRRTDYNGRNTPSHWHKSLEIVMATAGKFTFYIDGRKYLMEPGNIIVVGPKAVHSTQVNDTAANSVLLQIPYDFLENNIEGFAERRFACDLNDTTVSREALGRMRRCMKDMDRFSSEKPDGYRLKTRALLYEIVYLLQTAFSVKTMPECKCHKSDISEERIEYVRSYVDQYFAEAITLTGMAKKMCLNREYFARFFKQNMGITFMQYVNDIRLNHVCVELMDTNDSITAIAARNGFTNYKLFVKYFKEHYGCSPHERRKTLGTGRPAASRHSFQNLYCYRS